MIDTLPQTSSIPLDAVRSYPDALSRPLPRRPGRGTVSRHAYSEGANVVLAAAPLHEGDVAGSRLNGELLAAVRQLARLLSMPSDWDSYGAKPIDRQIAIAALNLVGIVVVNGAPLPALIPTSDGGIQLEWHRCGVDLEIRVISGMSLGVFLEDLATGEIREEEIGADLTPLRSFLDRVSC